MNLPGNKKWPQTRKKSEILPAGLMNNGTGNIFNDIHGLTKQTRHELPPLIGLSV